MTQPKVKKIPLRKCVITNTQYPKPELFRVVRTPENEVVYDPTGKVRGHGVYLVKDLEVIKKAKSKHALDRHLETKVSDEIYDELIKRLTDE